MKKIFASLISIFIISFSCNAYNWFDDRYFEMGLDFSFGFSNNALQANDILTKNLVIDFKELSSRVPNSGMQFNFYANPALSFKLDLRKIQIGLKSGVDSWSRTALSKDLFDYLGNGNELYQTVEISQKVNADVFAYEEILIGFKIKKFKISVKPAFFVPILHVGSSDGALTLENLEDGSIIVDYKSEMEIYSAFGFDNEGFAPGVGFDIAGSVSYPLFDFLTLTANARIPFIPGSLKYKTTQTITMNFETSVDKIINGNLGSNNFDSSRSDSVSTTYYINRPMKFSVFGDFNLFDNFVLFTGGLGLGFRHPFTDDIDTFEFFGEYYLGGSFTLLKILKFTFSTEYFEQLFIHQIALMANLRVFELDFGINAQSADFIRSCSGSGLGGFIGLKFGY